MKKRIMLANPRTGSSWVQMYINRYNKHRFGMTSVRDRYEGSELFDFDNVDFVVDGEMIQLRNFDQKIEFLRARRAMGVEYSIKIFYDQIEHRLPWFEEFYSDWEVIKLTRKDAFSQFMSYIMHTPSFLEMVEIDLDHGLKRFVEDFMSYYYRMEDFDHYDHHFVYEELTDDILSKFFEIDDILRDHQMVEFRGLLSDMKVERDYRSECKHYDTIREIFYNVKDSMDLSRKLG